MARGRQVVWPAYGQPLEADRTQPFDVMLPEAHRVAVACGGQLFNLPCVAGRPATADAGGEGQQPAPGSRPGTSSGSDGPASHTFAASLTLPRAISASLLAYVHDADLSSCAWLPLAHWEVRAQGQHVVQLAGEEGQAEYDPNHFQVRGRAVRRSRGRGLAAW